MRKNVAAQHVGFGLVNASTGAALSGATCSGYLSIDGGAQAALSGTFTGLGNGQYDYAPTQAETNGNCLNFFFTAATAIPVCLTIYSTAANPADASALGLTNLDVVLSTRAVESTVAKEATLNAKIPTALSFTGANVNADSKVTAAPTDMALDSTVAKQALLLTVAGYIDTEITDILSRLPAALVGGKMDSVVDKTGYALSAAGVDAIWDEVLDNASHSIYGSAAVRLRCLASVQHATVVSSPTVNSFVSSLTSATGGFYNDSMVRFTSGGLTRITRVVFSYDGATKTITFDEDLPSAPSAGDAFDIFTSHNHPITQIGVMAAAQLAVRIFEGTLTFEQLLRILLAHAAGITTDDGKEFYDLAGAKKRIDGTMVGKDRTVAVLDGT